MSTADGTFTSLGAVRTASVAETEDVAAKLALVLEAGDRIALAGDLGGGKTAFVRGVVRGLGSPHVREVASPTFALHHRYPDGRLLVDHCDLYRLKPPADLAAEGLDLVTRDPVGVLCVEWAERAAEGFRDFDLRIEFIYAGEDARILRFSARPAVAERFRSALP